MSLISTIARSTGAASIVFAMAACGGRSSLIEGPWAAPVDAGAARRDAGRADVGRDAGRDASLDASVDAARFDASRPDAGVTETDVDAGLLDAGADAAVRDAGVDAHDHGALAQHTLALGVEHTCALDVDGVHCWGTNTGGELGDGTLVPRAAPGAVVDLADVVGVSSGWGYLTASGLMGSHTCAWTTDGQAHCWGPNAQLESMLDPPALAHALPESLAAYGYVLDLGGSCYFECALNRDGEVLCRSTAEPVPVFVTLPLDATRVVGGYLGGCALLTDHTVSCWGGAGFGFLGDGSTTPRPTAGPVPGLTNVTGISSSGFDTCALLESSTVECWGWNAFGQIGDGTLTNRPTPTPVVGLTDVVQISAGSRHTCALHADRTVSCWGSNDRGQLGIGSTGGTITTPMPVVGLDHVVEIATGAHWHTCARRDDDSIWCWGDNSSGELGDGTMTNSATPIRVYPSP